MSPQPNQPNKATMPPPLSTAEITQTNQRFLQRSVVLRNFCGDPTLLMKRVSFGFLRFTNVVADGAHGEVWKGELEGRVVAIKKLKPGKEDNIVELEYFTNEIGIAASLDHPNIVRFIGVAWRTLPELSIISEFMPMGDLGHLLVSKQGKQMTWKDEKLAFATDIANALVYLHSLRPMIIHRDLKSLNVLITENYEAKLSDFGLSRERSMDETMTCGVGTMLWTAPEVLRGDRYSEKSDIYSFGIVLTELDTCRPPYALNKEPECDRTKKVQLMSLLSKGAIRPQLTLTCPYPVQVLIDSCLNLDPAKRPSAMELVYLMRSSVHPSL